MYGAPLWSRELKRESEATRMLRNTQELLIIRIARTYRTVSYYAGIGLSRIMAWHLEAESRARKYYRIEDARREEGWSRDVRDRIVGEERKRALRMWRSYVRGERTVGGVTSHGKLPGEMGRWGLRRGDLLDGANFNGTRMLRGILRAYREKEGWGMFHVWGG